MIGTSWISRFLRILRHYDERDMLSFLRDFYRSAQDRFGTNSQYTGLGDIIGGMGPFGVLAAALLVLTLIFALASRKSKTKGAARWGVLCGFLTAAASVAWYMFWVRPGSRYFIEPGITILTGSSVAVGVLGFVLTLVCFAHQRGVDKRKAEETRKQEEKEKQKAAAVSNAAKTAEDDQAITLKREMESIERQLEEVRKRKEALEAADAAKTKAPAPTRVESETKPAAPAPAPAPVESRPAAPERAPETPVEKNEAEEAEKDIRPEYVPSQPVAPAPQPVEEQAEPVREAPAQPAPVPVTVESALATAVAPTAQPTEVSVNGLDLVKGVSLKAATMKEWTLTKDYITVGKKQIPVADIKTVKHTPPANKLMQGVIQVFMKDGKFHTLGYAYAQSDTGAKVADYLNQRIYGALTPEQQVARDEFEAFKAGKERRMRCNVCGHLFCYSYQDLQKNLDLAKRARNAALRGALNTLATSQILGAQNQAEADRLTAQIKDYDHCPQCNSTDLKQLTDEEYRQALAEKNAPAAPAVSAADELRKFKELLDMGAITQDEFNAKKKQLLGL